MLVFITSFGFEINGKTPHVLTDGEIKVSPISLAGASRSSLNAEPYAFVVK